MKRNWVNEKIELLRDYKKRTLHAVKSKREITEKSWEDQSNERACRKTPFNQRRTQTSDTFIADIDDTRSEEETRTIWLFYLLL